MALKLNPGFSPADDKQLDSFQLRMPSQLILVSSNRTRFSVYTWAFQFLTVTEFLILMKTFLKPVTWEVDFASEANSLKNN